MNVIVKLPAGSDDNSSINIKLGNIEQTVSIVRKPIIPAAGAVINYYTENSGTYDFEYYLLTAKVDNSANGTVGYNEKQIMVWLVPDRIVFGRRRSN